MGLTVQYGCQTSNRYDDFLNLKDISKEIQIQNSLNEKEKSKKKKNRQRKTPKKPKQKIATTDNKADAEQTEIVAPTPADEEIVSEQTKSDCDYVEAATPSQTDDTIKGKITAPLSWNQMCDDMDLPEEKPAISNQNQCTDNDSSSKRYYTTIFYNKNFGNGRTRGRQSGSDRTGIKAVEKRRGAGAYNWGNYKDDVDKTPEPKKNGKNFRANSGEKDNKIPVTIESKEYPEHNEDNKIVFVDWKAGQTEQNKPLYNTRKAGEGGDVSEWQNMVALDKSTRTNNNYSVQPTENVAQKPSLNINANDKKKQYRAFTCQKVLINNFEKHVK